MSNVDLNDRSVPEEVMPHVFSCVGMIVVSWTFVENALDAWCATAFHNHGGDRIDSQMPREFSRKTKYLRKCFEKIPSLSPFYAECISFIARVEKLSRIRHFVAHGTLSSFDPSDESFVFVKIDVNSQRVGHKFEELNIRAVDLVKAGTDLVELAAQGQAISTRLMDASEGL